MFKDLALLTALGQRPFINPRRLNPAGLAHKSITSSVANSIFLLADGSERGAAPMAKSS
jgi:hypothetical protein